MAKRFPALAAKYSGEPRLTGPWPRFKKGDVVFVCHMTDINAIDAELHHAVIQHCMKHPEAEYIFQSKQPWYFADVLKYGKHYYPPKRIFGTTIETDYANLVLRAQAIGKLRAAGEKTFITVEPIQRFSPDFAVILISIGPSFVNIGADSKHSGLPEPTADEVRELILDLRGAGIEVRAKPNLRRIVEIQ